MGVGSAEHEWVAGAAPGVRIQGGEGAFGVGARVCALLRAEVDVAEGDHRRRLETLAVVLEVAPQLGLVDRLANGQIVGEERELLHQPPAHDRVAFVEAQPLGLAHQNLLPHMLLEQPLELARGRCAAGLRLPELGEPPALGGRDDDGVLGVALRRPPCALDGEDAGADQQEREQRILEPARQPRNALWIRLPHFPRQRMRSSRVLA